MKRSLFLRLFPPPNYLAMRPVGIDLSDRSLKYCRLAFSGSKPKLEAFGERTISAGVIEGGRIKDSGAVVAALREVSKDLGSKYVVAALPEEPGFTFVLSLPAASRDNLRQAIELQLEEHIPLPASGVVFDYEILREVTPDDPKLKIVVSAFPQDLALEYSRIFFEAGLTLAALEGEVQATVRALFPPASKGATLVIDLGKTHTSFFVVVDNLSVLTSTVAEIGGDFLTKVIEKGLGVKTAEAEELKNKRGLLQNQDCALIEALLPAVSVLRDEANKFMLYWNAQTEQSCQGLPVVSRVVLCGGQAVLPGLVEYLSASLGFKVEVGDVWKNILEVKLAVPPLNLNQSVRNAITIGLALRPFSSI
jgi:type IV pilus assembly protein PilM